MIKVIIAIVLLCTPPYGWVALLIWMGIACGSKKDAGGSTAAAAPAPARQTHQEEREPEPELLTAKVNGGRCELYSVSSGAYKRYVGSNIAQASVGGDYVAAVTRDGRVEIYQASTGAYKRYVGHFDAVSAQVQGDDVAVTTQSGRVEIYDITNGAYKRHI